MTPEILALQLATEWNATVVADLYCGDGCTDLNDKHEAQAPGETDDEQWLEPRRLAFPCR